jgi:hypothetical protein
MAALTQRFDLILDVLKRLFEGLPTCRIRGPLRKDAFSLQVQSLLASLVLGPLLLRNPAPFFIPCSVAGFQINLLRGSCHLFLH